MHAQVQGSRSITYIHQKKPTLMARIVKAGASLFVQKNSIKNKLAEDNFDSTAATIPKKYFIEFQIDICQIDDRNVYKISPKENSNDKIILYFHGGGYINNIFKGHWHFIAKLVRLTSCSVVIPDYPLAPASTYIDAYRMLDKLYKMLVSESDSQNIIFMGDSAGGGLALAFSQKNIVNEISQPLQIILISPWLDVSMTNPEIEAVQNKDPILNAKTLVLAGKAWSGNSELDNYLLSPIYGKLQGLPLISIFIGTHDILYPDFKKIKSLADAQNINMNYFEYNEMFHVWVLFSFLKEASQAINQIEKLIETENETK